MNIDSMNPRPRAIASGTIFGGVDCYVLGDGTTVLSQRGMLRGLRGIDAETAGPEKGDLGRYLARLPEKYSGLTADPNFEFVLPDGGLAHGRPARDFVAMCRAYAEMYAEGSIHKARIPIARNCIAILAGLADVGIDEIIYRASNYRAVVTIAPVPLPAVDLAEQLAAALAPFLKAFQSQGDRLSALEDQVRNSGTIAVERANAIKARVRQCADDLSRYGVEKKRAASFRMHKRLKRCVGWHGDHCRLDNMPARHEAEVAREMEVIEHETNGAIASRRQPVLLDVSASNTNRSKGVA